MPFGRRMPMVTFYVSLLASVCLMLVIPEVIYGTFEFLHRPDDSPPPPETIVGFGVFLCVIFCGLSLLHVLTAFWLKKSHGIAVFVSLLALSLITCAILAMMAGLRLYWLWLFIEGMVSALSVVNLVVIYEAHRAAAIRGFEVLPGQSASKDNPSAKAGTIRP